MRQQFCVGLDYETVWLACGLIGVERAASCCTAVRFCMHNFRSKNPEGSYKGVFSDRQSSIFRPTASLVSALKKGP
jgi:hypothetical protein